jgi:hypothetical protein
MKTGPLSRQGSVRNSKAPLTLAATGHELSNPVHKVWTAKRTEVLSGAYRLSYRIIVLNGIQFHDEF